MRVIQTRGLTKYYGKARGIEDVDLNVDAGEFFGFIGPNGAGKSTTIRTLLGLIFPTSGSAELFGMNSSDNKKEILNRVGYMPSETVFYSGMRVGELLKLSAQLRGMDCSIEAERLCNQLGLDTTRKVEELSFGNRKKVGIVCALQHNPELLIMDEPTSGLDPLMQKAFFDILQERNRAGVTIFLSSHVLSEIQRFCNRAAIIRDGRIIACDSVASLSASNAKRVTFRGTVDLNGIDGIRDWNVLHDRCSFLYGGRMDDLLRRLASGEVQDLTISEPDLDEIFMHYYQGGQDL